MITGAQMIKSLALMAVVALGGCEAAQDRIEDWSNIPDRHEPTASRVYGTHHVLFSPAQTRLNESEGRRLTSFVESLKIIATDKVYLVPGTDPAGRIREQAVTKYLAAVNVQVSRLSADVGASGPPDQAVSVIVSRYVVSLPGCPDWSGERFTYNNVPTSNWGCADATNLGRMVARPEDLIHGRDPGAFDGDFGTRSIDLYRKGLTKPLTTESVGPIENQQTTGQSSGGEGS